MASSINLRELAFKTKKMIFLIIVIPITLLSILILMYKIDREYSNNSYYAIEGTQENYSWAVAKFSMSLSEFETLSTEIIYGDNENIDKIKTSLDILFSRVNVIRNRSDSTRYLYMEEGYEDTVNRIYDDLVLIDSDFAQTEPDYKVIKMRLKKMKPDVKMIANLADHAEVLQRSLAFDDYLKTQKLIRILLIAAGSILLIVCALFLNELISLNKSLRSEKEAFNSKNAFLGKVGHELRSSLQAVIGSIDVISNSVDTTNKSVVSRLESAARQIERQMKDLSEYAKVDNGMISVTPTIFNLREAITTVINNCQRIHKNNDVKIICDDIDDIYIETDLTILSQIIENLFTNAQKYTFKGEVKVKARYEKLLNITITDTGYGIPKESQKDIFKPFVRIEKNESKIPGFGMGLAIVDGLVRTLKGQIYLKSELGKGSEFTVKIPVALHDGITDEKQDTLENSHIEAKNMRLLIIDDDKLACATIEGMMKSCGFTCETTNTPERAYQKLNRIPYDVVLCDIQMPLMTGDVLLQKIRESEGPNTNTPFIFISAYTEYDYIMDSKVMTKPVRTSDLLAEISKISTNNLTV